MTHAPLTTFSVIVESSDGRSMRLDSLGNTRDPSAKSVYLGRFDDSGSQTSVTWTARISSGVGAVTTSTLEFTTPTAPAPSTTR